MPQTEEDGDCAAIKWETVQPGEKDYVQCGRRGPKCKLEGLLLSLVAHLCEEHQRYFDKGTCSVTVLSRKK